MALWLLTRKRRDASGNSLIGWDEAAGFVVRARTSQEARNRVAHHLDEGFDDDVGGPGGERAATWLDPSKSSCVMLDPLGPERVILRDFNAG